MCSKSTKFHLRNTVITLFVIVWIIAFHYESLRFFYLNPYFGNSLPKIKFLFPPAGWIMFYNVDDQFGYVEVRGLKGSQAQLIDPHDIIRTRTVGFDNIHRGILGTVASTYQAAPFCRYLNRRFSYFDRFIVDYVYFPSITREHYRQIRSVLYVCPERE